MNIMHIYCIIINEYNSKINFLEVFQKIFYLYDSIIVKTCVWCYDVYCLITGSKVEDS